MGSSDVPQNGGVRIEEKTRAADCKSSVVGRGSATSSKDDEKTMFILRDRCEPVQSKKVDGKAETNERDVGSLANRRTFSSPVEDVLTCLSIINRHIHSHRKYIQSQNDNDQPLYEWTKYDGYKEFRRAVDQLDDAAARLKQTRSNPEDIAMPFSKAMQYSSSISRATADALAVINRRVEAYVTEMENSPLSEETKSRANAFVVAEMQKLLDYSAVAAEHVWAAVDLLQCFSEKARKKESSSTKSWVWPLVGIVVTAGISAVVGITVSQLYEPSRAHQTPNGNAMYTQVMDIVQRTHDVIDLTNELYHVNLNEFNHRHNALSQNTASQALRIDNIVESLGPPDEHGMFLATKSKSKSNSQTCGSVERHVEEIAKDTKLQTQRLREEMELMRKNMNRLDVRLTRRLDKIRD